MYDQGVLGVQYSYKLVKRENKKLNTFYNKENNPNSNDFYNTPKILFIFHNIIWKLVIQVAKLYGIEIWDGKITTRALISSNSASLFYHLFSIVGISNFDDILRASKANSKNNLNRYLIDSKKDTNLIPYIDTDLTDFKVFEKIYLEALDKYALTKKSLMTSKNL